MRLLFVGDVMLGRQVNEVLRQEPPTYPWGDTLSVFARADLRLCNLECALSDRGAPWTATPKAFHFRTDAKNTAVLQAAHIDAVSLANNHALDYGDEALLDTIALLDAAGIQHAGAGRTLEEAAKPAIMETPDGRVGLLAFTDDQPEWEALPLRLGVHYVPVDLRDPRAAQLLERVREARGAVDCLIVSAHWGPNWGSVPPPEQSPMAHALIDAGADVLFGHSGHIVRGIELYHQRPVLYCAGDFVDDYAVHPVERNDESCIFVLEAPHLQPCHLLLHPTVIDDMQARLATGDRAQDIAARLQRLCGGLGTLATWHPLAGCLEIVVPGPGEERSVPEGIEGDRG